MWNKIKNIYNQWIKPVEEVIFAIIGLPFLLGAVILLTFVKLVLYRTNYINIDIDITNNNESD